MSVETDTTDLAHSVLGVFHELARTDPERELFTLVDERGHDQETITVGGLVGAAEAIAEALRGWGFEAGDRAVLVYPPGADFIRALIGCLIAGVIPVPVYPPSPIRLKQELAGFNRIVANCRPRAVLTSGVYERAKTIGSVTSLLDRGKPNWPNLPWHRTDRCSAAGSGPLRWHEPTSQDEPALLQYTSGSTSAPKGVIITHGNLINETRCNARDLGLGADTLCVSWLPQYHDFGLISVIISSTTGNGHTYLLSPLTFLRRPHLWFEVMSRVRATHTAAPNFAFELAVRKTTPQQRASWDLSAMRVFMSAAEPIRPSTMDKFYAAFAASGVAQDTFYPAYGLAEHTVSVSMGGKAVLELDRRALERGEVRIAQADGDSAADGLSIFGCGRITKPEATVRVIDPETRRPTPPDRIGEIWVNSNTKAAGYYGLDAETKAVFRATVAEDDDPTEYLRTGDLGFFHDGELFVTGRVKDVIIVNGRNFHPEDLENSLRERTAGIRPGGLAAFSVPADDDEPERLIVFAESKDKKTSAARCQQIAEAIRHQLLADHRLAVHTVVVGRPGLVRKTTSGKVRRGACRQAYLANELGPTATAVVFPTG